MEVIALLSAATIRHKVFTRRILVAEKGLSSALNLHMKFLAELQPTKHSKSKAVLAGFVIIFLFVHALIMSRNSEFVRVLFCFRFTYYILCIYAQIYSIYQTKLHCPTVWLYNILYCTLCVFYEFSIPLSL